MAPIKHQRRSLSILDRPSSLSRKCLDPQCRAIRYSERIPGCFVNPFGLNHVVVVIGSERVWIPQHVLPLGCILSSCPNNLKTEPERSLFPATAGGEGVPTSVIPAYDAEDAWWLDESVQKVITELERTECHSRKIATELEAQSPAIDVQLEFACLRIQD